MNSSFVAMILALVAVATIAEPIDFLGKNATKIHALCSPCTEVFEKLNLSAGNGNKTLLTKERLQKKAKDLCLTVITKPYELKCQKVVTQNVDNVFKFIQKDGKKIRSLPICKHIGLC